MSRFCTIRLPTILLPFTPKMYWKQRCTYIYFTRRTARSAIDIIINLWILYDRNQSALENKLRLCSTEDWGPIDHATVLANPQCNSNRWPTTLSFNSDDELWSLYRPRSKFSWFKSYSGNGLSDVTDFITFIANAVYSVTMASGLEQNTE